MILVVYKKSTKEILHYVSYEGEIKPTIFGIFHACIKKNYPSLSYDDVDGILVSDSIKEKLIQSKRLDQIM